MIRVVSSQNSERLRYACHVLFKVILGIDFIVVTENPADNETPTLVYGIGSGNVSIPSCGLLFETVISSKEPDIKSDGKIVKFFFGNDDPSTYTFDFDIFSSAFFLLTEYYNYSNISLDRYGRYNESSNALFEKQYFRIPLVNQYAEQIFEKLVEKYPSIKSKNRKLDYQITFDIDHPYRFKYRSTLKNTAAIIRDILRLHPEKSIERIKWLIKDIDPFDVYDEIFSRIKPEKGIFFFLVGGKTKYDSDFTANNKGYRNLIHRIVNEGYTVGIHPSFEAFDNLEMIKREKESLEEIIGKEVSVSRMHFLKYRLPITNNLLIKAGIKDDYTGYPLPGPGFKHFITTPFPWFDLEKNTITSLTLHPTMVMDRTFINNQISNKSAIEEIARVINSVDSYGGMFTALFHNQILSNYDEWKGKKTLFYSTIEFLNNQTIASRT